METFTTGAKRDANDKPRPDLISPFALERLGEWLRLGAEKYDERNWEKGLPISRTVASLVRHLVKFQQGDTSEDHIAAVMCNAMFILHEQEMIKRGVHPRELDDMPDYKSMQDSKKYWVLVWSDRQDTKKNGTPISPIDSPPGIPLGMMVYRNEGEAVAAANHQKELYGIMCRPVLLGSEYQND